MAAPRSERNVGIVWGNRDPIARPERAHPLPEGAGIGWPLLRLRRRLGMPTRALQEWIVLKRVNKAGEGDDNASTIEPLKPEAPEKPPKETLF